MLLLLSLMIVGCSNANKKTEVKTNEPKQEQKDDDKAVEEKQSDDTAENKKTESKVNEDSKSPTSNTNNDKAIKSTEKTSKTEDISTKNNQTTSQSSAQSNSTSSSTSVSTNSQPSETAPTPPVENVVPDKQPEQEKTKNYKVGNCGKLYNTESEARAVADANNGTFTDTYFISGYFLYSTYDKWSFDYYYTYFK